MPQILIQVFSFIFGTIIGSFLNVCILRIPDEDKDISHPRTSQCPKCATPIRWFQNIPLVSYIFLKGRCANCKEEISLRYFIVELLTGLLVLNLVTLYGLSDNPSWGMTAVYVAFVSSLVVITFIDLDHQIIPDVIDKPWMVAGPILALIVPALHLVPGPNPLPKFCSMFPFLSRIPGLGGLNQPSTYEWLAGHPTLTALISSITGIGIGLGLIWIVRAIGSAIAKQEAMGLGDVKLMGMIGGILGPGNVLMTLVISCIAGSVVGITIYILTKNRKIPFGPYLALGAIMLVMWEETIYHIAFVWYPSLFS